MSKRITIDHAEDLTMGINNEIIIRSVDDSSLQVLSDGLYSEAKPGEDASGGKGYDDYYTDEGIRLGYLDPFSNTKNPRRVVTTTYVHRIFDAEDEKGWTLINFRNSIDYVQIRDMYRVDQGNGTYKYFLVTKTINTDLTTQVEESVELGVW